MPGPRFHHGFENDVFISYTHEDNREEAGIQWVTRFQADLEARLAKVSGKSIKTWRDNRLSGADRFTQEIKQQVKASAVVVAVLTPSYFSSDWCADERRHFIEHAASGPGLDVGNKSRLIKASKTQVKVSNYPPELRDLLEFSFFVEEDTGTAREFHLSPDPAVRHRYAMCIDDMAQNISKILSGMESAGIVPNRGSVYVGETSYDVKEDRDQLRRSLTQRGYTVLPQSSLRGEIGLEVQRIAKRDLEQCQLAVYPVGAYYAPIPEGAGGRSITELQIDAAVHDRRNGALPRMLWIPPGVTQPDTEQAIWLERAKRELPTRGFEVIELRPTDIDTHIQDKLKSKAPKADDDTQTESPEIYLLCLPEDRQEALKVRDFLFEKQHFEVKLPPVRGQNLAVLHDKRLASADAFLIYWGHGDESWVEQQLYDLKRAKGLRAGKKICMKAILLAHPED